MRVSNMLILGLRPFISIIACIMMLMYELDDKCVDFSLFPLPLLPPPLPSPPPFFSPLPLFFLFLFLRMLRRDLRKGTLKVPLKGLSP